MSALGKRCCFSLAVGMTVCLGAFAQNSNAKGRVIILGFDGVEPSIVQTMIDAGELPNLKSLSEKGVFTKLSTANPPQSPTAWSSFITCKNPGAHGIYDFMKRTPRNYMPGIGFGSPDHTKLSADGTVQTPAVFKSDRQGASFWSVADDAGMRSKILLVPFAYPAEDLDQGHMLCGLGVPDIRGMTSTFFALSTRFSKERSVAGGFEMPLSLQDGKATIDIPGARDMREKYSSPNAYVKVPLTVSVDRDAATATFDVQGQSVTLPESEWSKWVEWSFEVSPSYSVKAVSRFYALNISADDVTLYMSCLQFHPDDPYIRFTTPPEYASELKGRYGLFKTIGWAYDTHALRQNALDEEAFLKDIANTMAWREKLALDEIDSNEFDLTVAAWTGTDRVSHMFWRFRDPKHPLYTAEGAEKYGRAVEDTYIKMDGIVGEVVERLKENDLLMVLSDHGFHSYHTGFNVNTWLIRNGYLAVKGQTDPAKAFTDEAYLQSYDWANTKAYSIGLGSIFLNLKGREGMGTVAPAEADALIAEIREKLLAIKDPATGDPVFRAIYTRDDYKGGAMADAPDIQLGYAEGYQSTKSAANGAAPEALFEPNDDKWSGEHASSDVAFTEGIFFSNQPINTESPDIRDLGVTALQYLGVPAPADFEGKDLLAGKN